ncbi:hypothetical protein [Shivajiella indica]|uniref:CsbD family protein n=1 Tax=Shivajiella indica TaxID=872115 RepID=A0ABW5B763_9BACT
MYQVLSMVYKVAKAKVKRAKAKGKRGDGLTQRRRDVETKGRRESGE